MTKEIALGNRGTLIVDDEDYERVTQYKWTLDTNGYAVRTIRARPNQVGKKVLFHRFLLDAPDGVQVDHINRDKLDNRRCNLRLVTQAQNNRNVASRSGAKSQYKGVTVDRAGMIWRAEIWLNGKTKHLGRYKDEMDAARAYDRAAYAHWGEYAYLNFPGDMAQSVSAARS